MKGIDFRKLQMSKGFNGVFVAAVGALLFATVYGMGLDLGTYHGQKDRDAVWSNAIHSLYKEKISENKKSEEDGES